MENIKNILESILNEEASDKVKERLVAKYKSNPKTQGFNDDHYKMVIDHIHDNFLPDANKSQADLEWLADKHFESTTPVYNGADDVKHKLTEFNKPIIKEKMPKKKLNQYKSWDEFSTAIEPHIGSAPTVKETVNKDTKVLFKNDTHIVRQHMTHESMVEAAKLHPDNPHYGTCGGKATWCVSADSEQGKSYYDSYTKEGQHPFYTIEHTDKHPTDPNRKFAVLADPYKNLYYSNNYAMGSGLEFRNEKQDHGWEHKYVSTHDNDSISNTAPMQYLKEKFGYKGNGKFERKDEWGHTYSYSINSDGDYHGEVTTKSSDGKVLDSINYHNGVKHGASQTRNMLDDHINKANYVNGDLEGSWKTFHKVTGELIKHYQFENGVKHGKGVDYYHDEKGVYGIRSESEYDKGNYRDHKEYREDGTLKTHGKFDKFSNLIEKNQYNRAGRLYSTETPHGTDGSKIVEYHSNGLTKSESIHDRRGYTLSKSSWNEDGKLESTESNGGKFTAHFSPDDSEHPTHTIVNNTDGDYVTTHYHQGTPKVKRKTYTNTMGRNPNVTEIHFDENEQPTYAHTKIGNKTESEVSYENGYPKTREEYDVNTSPLKHKRTIHYAPNSSHISKIIDHGDSFTPSKVTHYDNEKVTNTEYVNHENKFIVETKSSFRKMIEG